MKRSPENNFTPKADADAFLLNRQHCDNFDSGKFDHSSKITIAISCGDVATQHLRLLNGYVHNHQGWRSLVIPTTNVGNSDCGSHDYHGKYRNADDIQQNRQTRNRRS